MYSKGGKAADKEHIELSQLLWAREALQEGAQIVMLTKKNSSRSVAYQLPRMILNKKVSNHTLSFIPYLDWEIIQVNTDWEYRILF